MIGQPSPQVYRAGWDAAVAGRPREACPYDEGDDPAWAQACATPTSRAADDPRHVRLGSTGRCPRCGR